PLPHRQGKRGWLRASTPPSPSNSSRVPVTHIVSCWTYGGGQSRCRGSITAAPSARLKFESGELKMRQRSQSSARLTPILANEYVVIRTRLDGYDNDLFFRRILH